ncbi:MAG: protein-disulfide reductase DsbD domain-containing protein, partial [Bdellovibrionales bacterium]
MLLFFFALSTFAKESIKSDHVEIDLLTPDTFAANQETLIGFHFRPEKGWHVYWKNPGDSGAATKFQFSSHQVQVGATLWPYPKRLPVAHLTNIGYENEVVYLVPIQTKSVEKVELKVQLEWLVCKEDCVPGFGELA